MTRFLHLVTVRRRKKNPSKEITLDLKDDVIILGMKAGFCLKVAVPPSSLITRQDGEPASAHKSPTLLALMAG